MTADTLLSRLEGVRKTGPESHIARCPGPLHKHGDRHPSLSIRERPQGIVLLKCWTGCSVEEVLAAVGMTFDDLFPPRPIENSKAERRPFFPSDVFEIARLGTGVVAIMMEANGLDEATALREARWQADREKCWRAFLRNAQGIGAAPKQHRERLLARYQSEAIKRYGVRTGLDMVESLRSAIGSPFADCIEQN